MSHWPSSHQEEEQIGSDEHLKTMKTSVNIQPRGLHHPVVPEHKSVVVLNSNSKPPCRLNELGPAMSGLPCSGCKLLRLSDVGGYGTGKDMQFQSAWGVPWTCEEFIERACSAEHPMLRNNGVEETVAKSIRDCLIVSPAETAKRRFDKLRQWRALSAELQEREDELHKSFDEHQAAVLSGKKLLLFQELLNRAGHADTSLVAELIEGAKLTGRNRKSFVFPEVKPWKTETAEEVLKSKSVWVQKAVRAQCKPSGDEHVDQEVWRATQEEVSKHWLSGPYNSEEEVSRKLNSCEWVPSPRFGLKQGAKVRSIDNYSAGGINSAFAATEKVLLQSVDAVAALGKAMLTAVDDQRNVKVVSSSGKEFVGVLHSAWALQDARLVVGRTLDLEAAYRQVALRPSEQWANIILVWNPELRKPQYFFQHALPFGAAASVFLFNRCSCAL